MTYRRLLVPLDDSPTAQRGLAEALALARELRSTLVLLHVVELVPMDQRKENQQVLMAMARQRLTKFKDLTIGVQPPSVISGAPDRELMFFLQGPDLEVLNKYALQIKGELAKVPGVVDLDTSYEGGKPELRVRINRDKATQPADAVRPGDVLTITLDRPDQMNAFTPTMVRSLRSISCW